MKSSQEITALLDDWSQGRQEAFDELMPLVFKELRRIANNFLRKERGYHTLQPTALVNEAYLKLVGEKNMSWQNRAHFVGVAAQLMRYILIDHARSKHREKRGGDAERLSLDEAVNFFQQRDLDLVALDDALNRLAIIDELQSRIVELRFFGGLTIEETAEVLRLSPATIKREWSMAKAWLHQEISRV